MKSIRDRVIVQNIKMLYSLGKSCASVTCAGCILRTKEPYYLPDGSNSTCVYNIIMISMKLKPKVGGLRPDEFLEKINQIFSEGCDECDIKNKRKCKLYINSKCFPWFLRHKQF